MIPAEDTMLPFTLPTGWHSTTVGSEFFLILGKMLDAEKNVGILKPYLGNKSVQWGRIDTEDLSLIKLTPSDLRRYRLAKGDLLVCEGGDIGRSAMWRGELDECYFQKALHRVRSRGGFDPVLLRYLLEYYSKIGLLTNFATQTSIAHLPKDKFQVVPLPLPPLAEQEAIAEALSDADGVVEGLERLIEKKRRIKQGAMQDLLTAKRRLPGFSGEWVERKLGEIGYVKTGLTYSPDNVAKYGTLVLRSSNIQNERLAFENNVFVNVTVSEEATVRDGDLLICVRNGSRRLIGKTARIDARADGMAFGAFMSAFRSDMNDFLIWCFQSNVVQRQIEENLGATINQITNKTLKSLKVQLPLDDDERDEICRVLRDMDAEISALETRLQKARAIKEGMMQNLLTGRIRLV